MQQADNSLEARQMFATKKRGTKYTADNWILRRDHYINKTISIPIHVSENLAGDLSGLKGGDGILTFFNKVFASDGELQGW